jgi:hypothetical protein
MANNFTAITDLIKKYKINQSVGSVSHSKEAEPGADFSQIKEVVEHEPEVDVEKFVTPRAESIELPPDLQKLGLQQASTTQFPSLQNVKLPMSDEKVVVGLHAPVTSSVRWLATFAIYLLARAHLGLKIVGGKVVRVMKT